MKETKNILIFIILFSIIVSQCADNELNRSDSCSELANYILTTDCKTEGQNPEIQFGYRGIEIDRIKIVNFPCDTFDFNLEKFSHLTSFSIEGENVQYFIPHPQKGILRVEFRHTSLFPNLPDLKDYDDLLMFSYLFNFSKEWGNYDTCFINSLPIGITNIDISNCSFNYIVIDSLYKSITDLDLSYLNLKSLDASIYNLKSIQFLNLMGNDSLKKVDIKLFPSLKMIKLPEGYLMGKEDSNYLISKNIICNLISDSCYENNK